MMFPSTYRHFVDITGVNYEDATGIEGVTRDGLKTYLTTNRDEKLCGEYDRIFERKLKEFIHGVRVVKNYYLRNTDDLPSPDSVDKALRPHVLKYVYINSVAEDYIDPSVEDRMFLIARHWGTDVQ